MRLKFALATLIATLASANGAFAQGCAGIGIQQERLATAEGDFDRLGEIVAPDSARGHPRFRGAGNLENGFERLALRIWLRRGAEPAFGPVDHVTLAGQKHAGDAHDEDHDSRDAACGEMAPEKDFAQAHVVVEAGASGFGPAAEEVVIDAGEADAG